MGIDAFDSFYIIARSGRDSGIAGGQWGSVMKTILSFRGVGSLKAVGGLFAAVLALSACSERHQRIYEASSSGGDYAILNCEELRVAALTIDQRLGGSARYGTTGEPTDLLRQQRASIVDLRQSRNCPGGASPAVATPAQVVAEAQDTDRIEGKYLQVATFREPANRDDLVAKLAADGFDVGVRPIQLAGATYYRVVVGPLATISEIARIDRTIIRMGLNDAFFVID